MAPEQLARGDAEEVSAVRALVLSSVFPNSKQPNFGRSVQARVRRVARHCELVVVAPVPWFPLNGLIRGSHWSGIPRAEWQEGVRVYRPRFFCTPRYGKWLDGVFYASTLIPFLRRFRREFPFELIDAHFAYPDGFAAALAGKVLGCPIMITLRGSLVRLATYRLHRPQLRFALSAAARIVAVSDSLKQVAVSLGVSAEKVRVVPNGVDGDLFRPLDRAEARRSVGLPPDGRVLISVGPLNEGKGHHRVVTLLPDLLRECPDLLYVIVGDERPGDNYRPVLDRLVNCYGLQEHVRIVEERPHSEIPRWLAAADVFCLATRSEGWSNAIMEALACGLPVVTTRVGGNPEIIANDTLGLLVPSNDDRPLATAILAAFDRPWDRTVIASHARRYSWDAASAAVLEEWQRIGSMAGVVGERRPAVSGRAGGGAL